MSPPQTATAGAARVAGRRPSLPNARAVVGGLLVAAAAVGTFAAWSGAGAPPSTRYVVAAHDLPGGRLVEPSDLRIVPVEAPATLAARAVESVGLVAGQRTVAPLAEGELVQRSAVVVPEGDGEGRQLSFALDVADALAGTLEVGEAVDLLATYGATAEDSRTEVVAAGATVAGLPFGDGGDGGQLVLLLSLPDGSDALAVTNAVRQGSVTVVRSLGAPLRPGDRFEARLRPDPGA
jgi:hypothetical protein